MTAHMIVSFAWLIGAKKMDNTAAPIAGHRRIKGRLVGERSSAP